MNAEVLIRARKVFVENNIVEYSETCPHCSSKGLDNKLRYFYLSLEEAIYKCQNTNCLYPFERFMFKSLIDNSVYYYEEVIDGGREAYLRVPLDEHNKYEHQNPIATDFFCDSQRNPNIEDYSFDFSDLFDDFEPEQKPLPKSSTDIENPDSLEFLDEIAPQLQTTDFSASYVLNENGIDSIINNILDESPMKNSPIESTDNSQKTNKPKPEAKLSKCMKHIERVKNAKNQKTREKSAFATAIRKARKSQAKASSDVTTIISNLDYESQTQPQLQPQQQKKPGAMESLLKSANYLRPTELAEKLGSLDLTVNSNFLRNYMKVKEEKEFPVETIRTETSIARVKSSIPTPNEISENKNDLPSIEGYKIISFTAPTSQGTAKLKAPMKFVKKELIENVNNSGVAGGKVGKPRTKKTKGDTDAPNVNVRESVVLDKISNVNLNGKEAKAAPSKRKSQKNLSATQNLENTQKLDFNEIDTKKPEVQKRRRKESKSKHVSKTELDPPVAKKPRKRKCPNEPMTGQIEDQEQKPKPKRTSKPEPKKKSCTIEPLQRLTTDTLTFVNATNNCQQSIPLTALETIESNSSTTITDSESSREPLLGFDEHDNNVKDLEKLYEVTSKVEKLSKQTVPLNRGEDIIETVKNVKKSTRKKSVENKSKKDNGKQLKMEKSHQNSSKRSKKNGNEIKIDSMLEKTSAGEPADVVIDIVVEDDSSENDKHSTEFESMDGPSFLVEDAPKNSVATKKRKQISIDSPHYYRKTFKQAVDQSFKVDRLLNEWDDSENEHFDGQQETKTPNPCLKSSEHSENDDAISIISIASEISDSSFTFIGDPYFVENPNDEATI